MGWQDPPQPTMPGPPNVGTCPGSPSNITMSAGTAPSSPSNLAPRWSPSQGYDTSPGQSLPGGPPSSAFRQGPPNTTPNLSAPQSVMRLGPPNYSMPQSIPSSSPSSSKSSGGGFGSGGVKSFPGKGGTSGQMKPMETALTIGVIVLVVIMFL